MPRARRPGSGGARTGSPGRAPTPNRSDLNTPGVGQTYGVASAQQSAMRAVPIRPPAPTAPGPGGAAGPAPPPGAFTRGTDRPDEPVTAGLPVGSGAGPEALGVDFRDPPEVAEVRAIYLSFPTTELGEILEDWDHGVRF